MKQIIKITAVALVAIFIMASCDKDQKCINWLEGDWDVSSLKTTDSSGNSFELIGTIDTFGTTANTSGEFVFEKYNNNKEEEGDAALYVSITATIFGFTTTQVDTTEFTYQIMNDCETIRLTEKDGNETDDATIVEASKKRMVYSYTDDDGTKYDVVIDKKE